MQHEIFIILDNISFQYSQILSRHENEIENLTWKIWAEKIGKGIVAILKFLRVNFQMDFAISILH